jgi:Cu-processing system ATP-binding protein
LTTSSVELASVAKDYGGHWALQDVDLVLRPGECTALAGHNGAGKSTLIKLMIGLIRPTRGTVRVLGEDMAAGGSTRIRDQIGYLPENVAFYPAMTGEETMAFYARLKRQPLSRNADLLAQVGIARAGSRRVATYSKGMRQRLALAQALLGQPKLLLLDEPTTGLDPALRQEFYEIVRKLRDEGVTLLISSHALAELQGQADRIIIMNRGRKVADGTMTDLRRAAALPVRIAIRLAEPLRVAVNDSAHPLASWTPKDDRNYELSCLEQDKAAAIQALGSIPVALADVEVTQPGLEDIYAHFLKRVDE